MTFTLVMHLNQVTRQRTILMVILYDVVGENKKLYPHALFFGFMEGFMTILFFRYNAHTNWLIEKVQYNFISYLGRKIRTEPRTGRSPIWCSNV